ncbi:MAG: hypothetical protein ACJ0GQ_05545 [Parasynechococcus sp.]
MRASGFSSRVSRRRLLQLGAVAGAGLVAACRRGTAPPQLRAARGLLPKPWSEQLPSPWTWSWQEAETTDRDDQDRDDQERVGGDLLALNDGWLQGLPPDQLQRIQAPPLEQRLGAQAQRLLALQGELLAGKVLPVGVSPWVMLFRNGAAWAEAARAGWDVLLQPSLRGRGDSSRESPLGDRSGGSLWGGLHPATSAAAAADHGRPPRHQLVAQGQGPGGGAAPAALHAPVAP